MTSFNELTPQEIVAAPLTLYTNTVGTGEPPVTATSTQLLASGWSLLGTSGDEDYDQAGITVTHNGTYTTWTPVGSTAPNKVWRTAEDLTLSVTVADITPDTYAYAVNSPEVITITPASGHSASQVPLLQGINVSVFSLLAIGVSGLNNTLPALYWVPCVYQSGNASPVFKLGSPAELALTFSALLDPNGNGFGNLTEQSS